MNEGSKVQSARRGQLWRFFLVFSALALPLLGCGGQSSSGTSVLEATEVRTEYPPNTACRRYGPELVTQVVDRDAPAVAVFLPGEDRPALIRTRETIFFAESLVPGSMVDADWIEVPLEPASDEVRFVQSTHLGGLAGNLFLELEGPLDDLQELHDQGEVSTMPGASDDDRSEFPSLAWSTEDDRVVSGKVSGSTADGENITTHMRKVEPPVTSVSMPHAQVVPIAEVPVGPLIAFSPPWDGECTDHSRFDAERRSCLEEISEPVETWVREQPRAGWLNSNRC